MSEHIRGVDNVVADALPRNKSQVACSLLQVAEQGPVTIPEGVLDVVARVKPDWRGETVEYFFSKGVAESTRRSYTVAWTRYQGSCRREGGTPSRCHSKACVHLQRH